MARSKQNSSMRKPAEKLQNSDKSKPFVVSHNMVLSIAIPMTIGYLTTPLLGLVDTAVIGQLGSAALIGGLAVGAILVDIVFFTFNFLRSGTVGLTAQSFGATDEVEIQAILLRALGLAAIIGLVLVAASPVFLSIGLYLIAPGEAASNAATLYYQTRILSAPFALANYAFFGWFVGIGKNKTVLALQIFINGINIALSIFLVLVLEWGIVGVAIATIIAEILGTLAGLIIAWLSMNRQYTPSFQRLKNVTAIKKMMSMNLDIMIRSFALLFAFGYFTSQSARFGENILAANAILLHFFFVGGYFLDGLAIAAEQIAGRAIGAKDRESFLRAVKLTILWSFVLSVCMAMFYLLFGEQIIDLLTTSLPVRLEAKSYFFWAAFICIAGVLAFIMDGIYMGSTWSREMSITMTLSLIGFVMFWQIAQKYLDNHGLWMSFYCFLVLRGLTMSALLPRNIRRTFAL